MLLRAIAPMQPHYGMAFVVLEQRATCNICDGPSCSCRMGTRGHLLACTFLDAGRTQDEAQRKACPLHRSVGPVHMGSQSRLLSRREFLPQQNLAAFVASVHARHNAQACFRVHASSTRACLHDRKRCAEPPSRGHKADTAVTHLSCLNCQGLSSGSQSGGRFHGAPLPELRFLSLKQLKVSL